MRRVGYLYILASKQNGTLYVGVTNSLLHRIYQHREGLVGGFTKKYKVKRLVYVEEYESVVDAIQREKTIKGWTRAKKIALIESENPGWCDLYEDAGPFIF